MSLEDRLDDHEANKKAEAEAKLAHEKAEAVQQAQDDARRECGNSAEFDLVVDEMMEDITHAVQRCLHGNGDELLKAQGAYAALNSVLRKFGREIGWAIVRPSEAQTRQLGS